MNLTSAPYLLFLLVALLAYRTLGRSRSLSAGILCLFSLVFYATWNPLYCLPLLFTAAVDFSVGRSLGRVQGAAGRRALVATSLLLNLSVLAFFKYFNFFADSALNAWRETGHGSYSILFRVVLGAGISFYTFQSLSYVVDVYRRDADPCPSFLEYLAFVSFFPTLLAGPITRADTLLPQIRRGPLALDSETGGKALFLIALGLVKKLVLADTIAINLANRVFDLPGMFSSAEVLAGIYGYAVQIYCDFSGYSDIAIGSALLLGIALKDNFNSPYRSKDLAEFWRRWHISLSTWLRDYLFFSLPGKRPGSPLPYLNLVITFTLGGLWHGATWTFVLWGLMHGVGLAFLRLLQSRRRRPVKTPWWRSALGVFITFHFVAASWILFRCATLEQAWDVVRRLGSGSLGLGNVPLSVWAAVAAGLLFQWLPERSTSSAQRVFLAAPAPVQAALLLAVALLIHAAGAAGVAPFIYFSY